MFVGQDVTKQQAKERAESRRDEKQLPITAFLQPKAEGISLFSTFCLHNLFVTRCADTYASFAKLLGSPFTHSHTDFSWGCRFLFYGDLLHKRTAPGKTVGVAH
jgi:hypothetical protein